ncbi:hypothetical protein MSAN_01329000 [Mycena sanguinolenta]|uniref:Uncharacterized protein n=1 Tax=Mycena sanguinolenta TaxID=230812 RepID=A0A8H6YDU8_9AGAR|nr:hypothetical protein MSAN_01329000 [Mycena sanguinolenta]
MAHPKWVRLLTLVTFTSFSINPPSSCPPPAHGHFWPSSDFIPLPGYRYGSEALSRRLYMLSSRLNAVAWLPHHYVSASGIFYKEFCWPLGALNFCSNTPLHSFHRSPMQISLKAVPPLSSSVTILPLPPRFLTALDLVWFWNFANTSCFCPLSALLFWSIPCHCQQSAQVTHGIPAPRVPALRLQASPSARRPAFWQRTGTDRSHAQDSLEVLGPASPPDAYYISCSPTHRRRLPSFDVIGTLHAAVLCPYIQPIRRPDAPAAPSILSALAARSRAATIHL